MEFNYEVMKPKILVVEDRPENIAAAKECYSARDDYHFYYTKDYDEAMEALVGVTYLGIITDCFMPKKTGSGDISLGLSLIDRLVPRTQEVQAQRERLRNMLESYKELLDIDNPKVQRALYIDGGLRSLLWGLYNGKPKDENTRKYLEFSYGRLGDIKPYKGESDNWGAAKKDHAWILEQMMQQTEAAQPLGILIIDYARANKIPHFMLTARHDEIGESVLQKLCRDNNIKFGNPRESEKANPHYEAGWVLGLRVIESQIKSA